MQRGGVITGSQEMPAPCNQVKLQDQLVCRGLEVGSPPRVLTSLSVLRAFLIVLTCLDPTTLLNVSTLIFKKYFALLKGICIYLVCMGVFA